jgi:hypothetical protein
MEAYATLCRLVNMLQSEIITGIHICTFRDALVVWPSDELPARTGGQLEPRGDVRAPVIGLRWVMRRACAIGIA